MKIGRRSGGFTLVDVLITVAIVGVLAGVALPSYRAQMTKARRSDAVAALTRLQAAQERLRAGQGLYSADLGTLQVAARSAEGLYTLAVELTGPDSYRASATVLAGGAQAGDRDCPQLTLAVNSGFAQVEPNARCWNR
jgi:type IV pilus assembly protein PilE